MRFQMRIHILDRGAIDTGDLCWDGFNKCGTVTSFESTAPEQFIQHAKGAETLVVVGLGITKEMLDACPDLKFINLLSTGYDFVDVKAAKERGILVSNVSTYGTCSVAQMAFALLLELCNRVGVHDEAVRKGRWAESGKFSFWLTNLKELSGKTLGVVGIGRIGRAAAQIGSAFGMRVIAFDNYAPPAPEGAPYEMVGFDQLLAESDVVTLHCPLTDETRGILDEAAFRKMKRGALLINAARGGLVNEGDLCRALACGQLAGAGLDVTTCEPIPADSPLLSAPNLIITPHIAWATQEARARMIQLAVDNQAAFQRGAPINVVNP